jgi:hypothetical protein
MDFVFSQRFINPGKATIQYSNENQEDELPWGRHGAFSMKTSFSATTCSAICENPILSGFVNNIASLYLSVDSTIYGEKSENNKPELGVGAELTIFDVISIRRGHYNDEYGEVIGSTFGFGFNLNYRDLFQFQYNFSETPAGGLTDRNEIWDILFRTDFLKLYNLMNKKSYQ